MMKTKTLWPLSFFMILIVSTFFSFAQAEPVPFKVTALSAEDKKKVSDILKPFESKWIPAEEIKKSTELYWQGDMQAQSFKITSSQPGLEDVYFVPIQADYELGHAAPTRTWIQSLSLLVIDRKTSKITNLPTHPVMAWTFDHMESISFRDVQGNGSRAILVNAAGVTGVGPNGVEPFNVIAVYLPDGKGSWALDAKLQDQIDKQMYTKCKTESCRDLKTVEKFVVSYFKNKK